MTTERQYSVNLRGREEIIVATDPAAALRKGIIIEYRGNPRMIKEMMLMIGEYLGFAVHPVQEPSPIGTNGKCHYL